MTTADTQGMQGGNQLIYNAVYDNLVKQGSGLRPQNSESPEASQSYQDLLDYAHTLFIAPPRLPENYIINGITPSPYTMPVFMEKLFARSDSSKNESIFSATYHLDHNQNGFESLALTISDSGSS